MENLPHHLLINILSRLTDSSDLARCRLASKTLNSLSNSVTSLHLFCTYERYTKSRANPFLTPFKSIVTRNIIGMSELESVSLGVDYSLTGLTFDDLEDEENDLYLTDVEFVSDWLVFVKHRLKRLSFVDFWVQSCWRRSDVLALISRHCKKLNEIEVKNAWLSMEAVTRMRSLTSLTLEYIRLDDKDLSQLNKCFPCLRTLNLMGVGGLENPKICLKHLKNCQWIISNAPASLTIIAPNIVKLNLKCVKPRSLVLETPLLSDFNLTVETAGLSVVKELHHLQKLRLESSFLRDLIYSFRGCMDVKELSLDSINKINLVESEKPNLELIFYVFPNISSLSFGPGVYSDMEASYSVGKVRVGNGLKWLKNFRAHLVVTDVEVTLSFLSFIVDSCSNLSTISLLIHHKFDPANASSLISRCAGICSRAQWRWGFWKEGGNDVWVS